MLVDFHLERFRLAAVKLHPVLHRLIYLGQHGAEDGILQLGRHGERAGLALGGLEDEPCVGWHAVGELGEERQRGAALHFLVARLHAQQDCGIQHGDFKFLRLAATELHAVFKGLLGHRDGCGYHAVLGGHFKLLGFLAAMENQLGLARQLVLEGRRDGHCRVLLDGRVARLHLLQFRVGRGGVDGLDDGLRGRHELRERGDERHQGHGVKSLRARQPSGGHALDPAALLRLGDGVVDDALLQEVQLAGLRVRLLLERC